MKLSVAAVLTSLAALSLSSFLPLSKLAANAQQPTLRASRSSEDGMMMTMMAPTAAPSSRMMQPLPTPKRDATASCPSSLKSSFDGTEILTFRRPGRPDRTYRIYTPSQYDKSSPSSSKLVLAFHGWCGHGSSWSEDRTIQTLSDKYNYIVVAPDGLGENEGRCNSWSFPGSNTGLGGRNGNITTTCNTDIQVEPSHCYINSCGASRCDEMNRCPWTHCQDDDVQFVRDLLLGGSGDDGYINSLKDVVCFDRKQVYVLGASNGGMMTWSLLQDNRTASLFVAAAPMIGLPHCGYNQAPPAAGGSNTGGATAAVISLMSKDDDTVSPANLPFPGNPADTCIENRDGEGYRYVSSHRITSTFAQAAGCLQPSDSSDNSYVSFPSISYNDILTSRGGGRGSLSARKKKDRDEEIECKTWCTGNAPQVVDCAFSAGHWTPDYVYQAAFDFFELHSSGSRAKVDRAGDN